MRSKFCLGLALICLLGAVAPSWALEFCGVDANAGHFKSGFEAGEVPGIAEAILPADNTPLTLVIDGPPAAAMISTANAEVFGSFTAPPNTGITVNDIAAYHSGNQWLVQVPLQAGSNTLTVVLHALDGSTQTLTRNVDRAADPLAPEDVVVPNRSDIAAFHARFSINVTNLAQLSADFDGDGNIDLIDSAPSGSVNFVYRQPGRYRAEFTLTPNIGAPSTVARYLLAEHPSEVRQTLCHVFGVMRSKLIANDIPGALTALVTELRPGFQDFWTGVGAAELPTLAANLGTIVDGRFSPDQAELILARPDPDNPGQAFAFRVQFARNEDGIWRITAM